MGKGRTGNQRIGIGTAAQIKTIGSIATRTPHAAHTARTAHTVCKPCISSGLKNTPQTALTSAYPASCQTSYPASRQISCPASQHTLLLVALVLVLTVFFQMPAVGGFGGGSVSYAALDQSSEAFHLTVLSSTTVRLEWPEYNEGGYSFRIQVKRDDTSFTHLTDTSRTNTSYEVSELEPNSLYIFRIMLYDYATGKMEPYYNEVAYNTALAKFSPGELTFEPKDSTQMLLTWAYPDAAGFETVIERRRASESTWRIIATTRPGINRFTDTELEPNVYYQYRIKARLGHAVFSDYAARSVHSALAAPQLIAYYAVSPSSIYLEWSNSPDATRYQLERKQRGNLDFSIVATTDKDRLRFTDSGVIPEARYIYRVKAIGTGQAQSLYSDEVEVSAVFIDISYAISAVATGDYQIELRWSDMGDRESSYEVWRFDGQFPGWRSIATLDRNANAYTDNMVGPEETYTYKIRARSAEDNSYSEYSTETVATTKFLPPPSDLRQVRFSDTAITLSWRDNSVGESLFYIERRNGATGNWSMVTVTNPNITERTNLLINRTENWFYRVGAYSSEHRSVAYSEPMQVDNGFGITIMENSYYHNTENSLSQGSASTAAASSNSAKSTASTSASVSGPGSLGEIKLNTNVTTMLRKHKVVTVRDGVIVDGGDPVSRGEFVSMLVKVIKPDVKATGSFDDVKAGHPYYEDIMKAAKLGFVSADPVNRFYPDRVITREEISEFIFHCSISNQTPLPMHGIEAIRNFPDFGEVAKRSAGQVQAVFGEKIMIGIGMSDDQRIIGIERESTREQAALVIYRFLQWLGRL